MTSLITGGTGNTGSHLARLLDKAGQPVLVTSRKKDSTNTPYPTVTFDWFDPRTFQNPFEVAGDIARVYLVLPRADKLVDIVRPFIDLAISKGAKRFVLCAASSTVKGDKVFGEVYAYLEKVGVEHSVLKPTWFIENFVSRLGHPIREYNQFASATRDGLIPFVAAEDIAQAAFDKLTAEQAENGDFYVVGPEFLTHDEAAKILSEVLGREIVHKWQTEEESLQKYRQFLPEEIAQLLATAEVRSSKGSEEIRNKPNVITGKKTLREYLIENREALIKK